MHSKNYINIMCIHVDIEYVQWKSCSKLAIKLSCDALLEIDKYLKTVRYWELLIKFQLM